MKKIILAAVVILGIAGSASAQTSERSKNTHAVSSAKAPVTRSASSPVPADNRTEYMANGQKATATGHEATAVNGQHASKRKTPPKRAKGKH